MGGFLISDHPAYPKSLEFQNELPNAAAHANTVTENKIIVTSRTWNGVGADASTLPDGGNSPDRSVPLSALIGDNIVARS